MSHLISLLRYIMTLSYYFNLIKLEKFLRNLLADVLNDHKTKYHCLSESCKSWYLRFNFACRFNFYHNTTFFTIHIVKNLNKISR